MTQICDCMSYLHERNVLLRNLSPDQIGIDSNGHVKILSTFFCELVNQSHERYHEQARLAYTAPELVRELYWRELSLEQPTREDISLKSDFFVIGCIAYYLFHKEDAFLGVDPETKLRKILSVEPVPRLEGPTTPVSNHADHFIKWCMSKNPGQRPSL